MTGNAASSSIPQRMERARRFFVERAASQTTSTDRELCEQLQILAESIEEMETLMENLKFQLEEVRHGMGLHLESTGPVPHTRRGRLS